MKRKQAKDNMTALTFAFAAGLVAAFNPCGFAMLPTYLAYFIGGENKTPLQAVKTAGALTAGFITTFGTFGLLVSTILSQGDILEYTWLLTLTLGILLIPLGIAMLLGAEPTLNVPQLNIKIDGTDTKTIYMFGVSYAIVSLGCTVPIFMGAVVTSFTNSGILKGTSTFLAYSLGMASVIIFLTVLLAFAKQNAAQKMKKILPYVNKISGLLLITAGVYLASYGWWEKEPVTQQADGTFKSNSNFAIEKLSGWQAKINTFITDTGALKLGIALAIITTILIITSQRKKILYKKNPEK